MKAAKEGEQLLDETEQLGHRKSVTATTMTLYDTHKPPGILVNKVVDPQQIVCCE
ncbi:hypothetical protein NC651_017352 [Populus alba x Populus x berolinensis]|nr:hypothetical protein NC651_017352 [Populus alba x Populus x berolinensis]